MFAFCNSVYASTGLTAWDGSSDIALFDEEASEEADRARFLPWLTVETDESSGDDAGEGKLSI